VTAGAMLGYRAGGSMSLISVSPASSTLIVGKLSQHELCVCGLCPAWLCVDMDYGRVWWPVATA
jgi:hypothetical protein